MSVTEVPRYDPFSAHEPPLWCHSYTVSESTGSFESIAIYAGSTHRDPCAPAFLHRVLLLVDHVRTHEWMFGCDRACEGLLVALIRLLSQSLVSRCVQTHSPCPSSFSLVYLHFCSRDSHIVLVQRFVRVGSGGAPLTGLGYYWGIVWLRTISSAVSSLLVGGMLIFFSVLFEVRNLANIHHQSSRYGVHT